MSTRYAARGSKTRSLSGSAAANAKRCLSGWLWLILTEVRTVRLAAGDNWCLPDESTRVQIWRKACHSVVILYTSHDVSIATCFLGGNRAVVAKNLALCAFDRSYTPPSQDKAGFT